jgi:hypothetical protein
MAVTWDDLDRTIDACARAGKQAEFWWRDDDATLPVPEFARLTELARVSGVRPLIAVIPARAMPALATQPGLALCQHGWNHDNHAPLDASKAELGAHRPLPVVMGELARGWLRLVSLFPDARPILVPPHNRISKDAAGELALAGYQGLSTYGPRKAAPPGLAQVNTHCDIMDWHTRAFAGESVALGLAITHLRAKLDGTADPAEPTGLLTHHLAHDSAAWDFAEKLLRRLGIRWRDPDEIFASAA